MWGTKMGLLLEHIEIVEGEEEISTVIKAIRTGAKDVDEIRQYIEKSTGKSMADVSDSDIRQGIARGYNLARQGAGMAQSYVSPGMAKDAANKYDTYGKMAAPTVAGMADKGKYQAISPSGEPIDIDVDLSINDVASMMNMYNKLEKDFPNAAKRLRRGDFPGALNTLYKRMAR